jgi:hypothetical protein
VFEVLHGVEKVRGSRGGRGACDSVFRGFPPYRHCQIIQKLVLLYKGRKYHWVVLITGV